MSRVSYAEMLLELRDLALGTACLDRLRPIRQNLALPWEVAHGETDAAPNLTAVLSGSAHRCGGLSRP